jgi:hypothetical protein
MIPKGTQESDVPKHHRLILSKYGLLLVPENVEFMAFVETVKSDCAPYIKAIDYQVDNFQLLRGVKKTEKPYIAKRVRLDDRKPADVPKVIHDRINKFFVDKFGEPFRNAMFATSDYDQASEYAFGGMETGETYVVFPVGDFDFIWSKRVSDLLDEVFQHNLSTADMSRIDKKTLNKYFAKFSKHILASYIDKDLKAAIKSNNEVMIRCKEYYGIKWPSTVNHWNAFKDLLKYAD